MLCAPAILQVAVERAIDTARGDGSVADNVATRFGEEKGEDGQEDAAIDGEEPEDGAPAEIVCQDAADGGAECRAKEDT